MASPKLFLTQTGFMSIQYGTHTPDSTRRITVILKRYAKNYTVNRHAFTFSRCKDNTTPSKTITTPKSYPDTQIKPKIPNNVINNAL